MNPENNFVGFGPNIYDPEKSQEYIYDPEITNNWYWHESLD